MVDDANAPTIPETAAPGTSSKSGAPRAPDPRYEMRTLIGRGGMGEIWLAYDVRIDREVAVKLMRGEHDPDSVARFLREARVQGRLEHPAIVPVHDLGIGSEPYFVMKRLAGITLADVLAAKAKGDAHASEGWPVRTLLARLVDVCLAIELAHRRGVVHRDLKPANIMLGDFGEAYVLDWGLARVREAPEIRSADLPSEPDAAHTVAGTLLGTPGYMAPEQVRGEPVDHRADIYALGCILFEILAGQPAVPRESALDATLAADGHRPSRGGADIAPELDDACTRATAASPQARHESARSLADDIQRFLDGDRDLARRRELAVQHVATAERALATGDRAGAIREAGRAIAIDPDSRAAQDLMKHLLFELPSEVPIEAQRAIDDERAAATHTVARRGIVTYIGNLAIVALAMAAGARPVWPLAIIAGLIVFIIAMFANLARRTRLVTQGEITGVLAAHCLAIGCAATFLGPLLFAPILVFGSLAISLMFPGAYFPKRAVAMHALAVAVPLALEALSIVPRTVWIDGGALVFKPWAITMPPTTLVALLLALIGLQIGFDVVILHSQRKAQERAQERLHVYSWHLGKLLG